ncbi:protein kinase domain-containing protein [Tahibacter harae]|uniref:Winged helix-turn-helix domain-containing protein n=1 Tax=Tahibacter harae TaxID=2963937 RepID=A0ABT1QRS5_9GAMM|nr:tetratricopeptide repeat protein [Tahibacter harae]MCQ4164961.1 winged helix-turn-helix domain-containing protein [Tahibacter harae]
MKNEPESSERTSYSYRFGTAEFDEARFELRVAGLPVDVERRALEVLLYLLRHAGEVVTKEELLREVWAGRITVDKVLPNAINKLRRALGEANAERLLTQPRVGYRLDGAVERVAVGRRMASQLDVGAGQPVPGRENFLLRRQLGSNRGSEVWLAEHAKTREQRVYKFAADGERLRALKREVTLARVLQESLEDRRHFVDIIDWNFESAPFFLECEFGGQNLLEWAETELAATSQEQRLELFLQIADAVADAHSVGVLHKDLKPANVLIAPQDGGWLIRLTDFGSGRLLDPERVEKLGITRLGLTMTQNLAADSSSGTPLYIAPEVFAGHTPTAQSDVFALGIMLYQLLAGRLNRPMVSGWEQDIGDDLLREDIRLATDGEPQRRLASAAEFAARLREREQRRALREHTARREQQAEQARDLLARNRARRPYLVALMTALVVGILIVLGLYQTALRARNAARQELQRAVAINRFLNEDLIGRSNPLLVAKGQSVTLKDLLLGARERIARRFAGQPETEASIRNSLVTLFNMLDLLPEAEAEARQALALYERSQGEASLDALRARAMLIRVLTRTSKFDEAHTQLQTLDRLTGAAQDSYSRYLRNAAWGMYHMNQGEYAKALPEYLIAVPAQREAEPDNFTVGDSMRMDLIYAYTQNGKLAEARQEGESLIAEINARGDDNGLVPAFAKAAIARTYTMQGELAKAEEQLKQAQKTIVELLGPDHTRNIMVLSDLLDVAVKRHDWPQALDYAQRMHQGFLAKFGPEHTFTNVTAISLSQVLFESGDSRQALALLEPAYARLVAQFKPENPQSQAAAYWLAAVRLDLGQTEAAAPLLQTLDAKALESVAADGNWPARLDAARGLLLLQGGDRAAAQPLLRSGVEGLKNSEGERMAALARQALAGR